MWRPGKADKSNPSVKRNDGNSTKAVFPSLHFFCALAPEEITWFDRVRHLPFYTHFRDGSNPATIPRGDPHLAGAEAIGCPFRQRIDHPTVYNRIRQIFRDYWGLSCGQRMGKEVPFDQRPYRSNMEFRQPLSFPSSAILEIRFFK
jgi:hypothetical protein